MINWQALEALLGKDRNVCISIDEDLDTYTVHFWEEGDDIVATTAPTLAAALAMAIEAYNEHTAYNEADYYAEHSKNLYR